MGPGDLSAALAPLLRESDPRLLVGRETFDDAGVFRVSDDLALVQTVDFFAPIVDDPYRFGRVAAANALSDVYAMGGVPLTAMNIVGFPTKSLPLTVLTEILRGGQEAVHEAGALIVGGHTVIDDELKYGLAVTGRVHPDRILSNANAEPGDVLVLTKAIGTGILATAGKRDALTAEQEEALYLSMAELNKDASLAAVELGARCATDVTGFGVLGHARHIATASKVALRIRHAAVPLLPGARELVAAGHVPGGAKRNATWVAEVVDWNDCGDDVRTLLTDPQTSGGLLLSLRPELVAPYLARVPQGVVIGDVVRAAAGPAIHIE
jgi:selenide, water dikinase